jgi:predicted Rossmann fold flavoprotein
MSRDAVDLVVVGAGAAGLATAIFAARRAGHRSLVLVDGARRVGAKILVSGGGRCNVTNRSVTAADYSGGPARFVASVLKAFPAARAAAFFHEIGVSLHEEERGKLFPDTNRSRTVLDALLGELGRTAIPIETGHPVTGVAPRPGGGFLVDSATRGWECRRVVLATGGLALPKSGSDGSGLALAARLGHTVMATTPALAPLVLDGTFHARLSGVSHEAGLTIESGGRAVARISGPLLWTHFGISGPAALDASRHWLQVRARGEVASAFLSFVPAMEFADVDAALIAPATQGRRALRSVLIDWVPTAVADALLEMLALEGSARVAQLTREDRRRLSHALTAFPLSISGSRGYSYAEATAGGVSLHEVNPRTLESRRHPGLHLVGEILDVDGRLGGFNFQWAWSSGFVAGEAVGKALAGMDEERPSGDAERDSEDGTPKGPGVAL